MARPQAGRRLDADVRNVVNVVPAMPPVADTLAYARAAVDASPHLKALATTLDEAGLGGREAIESAINRNLRRMLQDYMHSMGDIIAEINSRLVRLADDMEVEVGADGRAIGTLFPRPVEQRATDIRVVAEQIAEIKSFDDAVKSGAFPIEPDAQLARDLRVAGVSATNIPQVNENSIQKSIDSILESTSAQGRGISANSMLRMAGGDAELVIGRILASSGSKDPGPAVLAVLRAAGLYNPSRVRKFNAQFMKNSLATVMADPNHPLRFLIDPTTGEWRSRAHADNYRPAVQAGHKVSFHSGAPERLFIEDADFNQWSNWFGENKGAIFHKDGVVIGGVAVERRTAMSYESLWVATDGKAGIPPGTVSNAPTSNGWAPE